MQACDNTLEGRSSSMLTRERLQINATRVMHLSRKINEVG